MTSRGLLLLPLLVSAACGGGALRGYTDSRAPGITLLATRAADGHKELARRELRVPMGEDAAVAENDALVLEFMDQAAGEGALYVSDVQIRLFNKENGAASDCITHAAPFETKDEQNRERWTMEFSRPRCVKLSRRIEDEARPHEVRGYIYVPK
jgi:hypothetical protein